MVDKLGKQSFDYSSPVANKKGSTRRDLQSTAAATDYMSPTRDEEESKTFTTPKKRKKNRFSPENFFAPEKDMAKRKVFDTSGPISRKLDFTSAASGTSPS